MDERNGGSAYELVDENIELSVDLFNVLGPGLMLSSSDVHLGSVRASEMIIMRREEQLTGQWTLRQM